MQPRPTQAFWIQLRRMRALRTPALNGAQDPRWPTQDLEQLKALPASAFEVVQLGPLIPGQ